MGRLFTIGDSISQGFRSGCTAFTEHAYSTYLATALGLGGKDYRYLRWPAEKLKCDLEAIFRLIQSRHGTTIDGVEWIKIFFDVSRFLDKAEDYYERGDGALGQPIPAYGHDFTDNCAVEGMRVADAWEVTPALCEARILQDPNGLRNNAGLAIASSPFYRAAHRVLNPACKRKYNDYSAVRWLQSVAETEGVDNIIIWLGANNALGTIFDLEVRLTPGTAATRGSRHDPEEETKYNLWHPRDFAHDYTLLLKKVEAALKKNQTSDWKVYLGTVPLVTIAPMLEGFGEARLVDDPQVPPGQAAKQFRYFQYYKHYGVNESTAIRDESKFLRFRDALFIDKVIGDYNATIRSLVAERNAALGRQAYVLVDLSTTLSTMAWKRNSGMPTFEYPPELQWLYPPLNTKFYRVNASGEITDGGIFSLDGIHPTVIGQGVIASEFLKAFKQSGSSPDQAALDWDQIVRDDTLRQDPIAVLHDIVEVDQAIDFVVQVFSLLGK
ncbi:hypothetical protein [Cyanobium sp. NIES-981]|uniref:hypothetical protein n=1 Tax=Cyanobium sp. NIES-981 TaxID=1851505 RepID=UPI0007DDE37D|nr:hypothetical protein [Cyanobium sp. NIES-981]SBO43247.1 conserved protein of unknown function [Cyanobium sp. NIES-981]